MESNDPLPRPVRNYAMKLMESLKETESVLRRPPRRRLMPLTNAQADSSKKVAMESNDPLPQPVRNYAMKIMESLKETESVLRGPPRRRLMPLSNAQADSSKKVKWATYQKAPSSIPVTNTRQSFQSRKSCIPSNPKGLTRSLAVPSTRAQTMKGSEKSMVATPEVREQRNRSRCTGIPVPKPGILKNSNRKSHAAASRKVSLNRHSVLAPQNRSRISKPSKVSEKEELKADISGVMLLEEDARSEIGAGDCSNNVALRIPLSPILQNSDRSGELYNFDDAFNSLQKEYLSELSKFHTEWMMKFRQLYKRREESAVRKVTKNAENVELMSQRKSMRLSQKKCDENIFPYDIPKETPSTRITNTARKQMTFL